MSDASSGPAPTTPVSDTEIEILRAMFHGGAVRVENAAILVMQTNVGFRGTEYIRAFRSLRARNYVSWTGHSITGGELYAINPKGKEAFSALPPDRR